jgi:tRNA nucleotidyltransferase (CCA-adding enzyme)
MGSSCYNKKDMRLIITHEQADFDAAASLLGAYLLDEGLIPVLPGRMNRNVRAFITLYGVELPFVDRKDLPSEPVEAVTLVDTQSLVSIKGMGPQTHVQVIDHHPRRNDLASGWEFNGEEIGANTTLFVEALREENGLSSMVHATLLLMGIYEDTGSLTYARTSARDLRAAAYLLDAGASLKIAAEFLNHPLSQGQQELYDRLRSHVKTYLVHGHTVIISCADAGEMEEEFSTVAHKLRDMLDPDALILLISGRAGVQMIARSTSDNIDVSDLAARFGGGGHSRAAAALIQGKAREELCDEVARILPEVILPAITVSQIMSRGPQVLGPDTPVEEAAERMQRYGYEGYPVVRDGKVIGLLTRRAVDRAISHKLNLTAASLMTAGEVYVYPGDSIEHLQRLMTDTGWGQIPVISPEDGQIIGIVTRTDLLKILTDGMKIVERMNLAGKLEAFLPPARLALLKMIAEAAHEQHVALYLVGGFVRDLMLDRPSLDFDLVVEGDAIALARRLAGQYGGRVTGHARFGTAKWYIGKAFSAAHNGETTPVSRLMEGSDLPVSAQNDKNVFPRFVDLITARTEFYSHPTALPTVERGSIKLDLHRRDFTINTLALRLDGRHWGELFDYWGGLNDLRQGLIRCLHSLSFVDDATRMLRAVRFEQRFGFKIEDRTLQLIREAVGLIDRVSGDRIRHELDHMLDEERAAEMFSRLAGLGLLYAIHPALGWDNWLYEKIHRLANDSIGLDWQKWFIANGDYSKVTQSAIPDGFAGEEHGRNWKGIPIKRAIGYILLVIRLPIEGARGVFARLRVPREVEKAALAACQLWSSLQDLDGKLPSVVVARLEDLPLLALAGVYVALDDQRSKELLSRFVLEWSRVIPTITGHELRAFGLPPGPIYARILSRLRDAWLDGEVKTIDEERELLNKFIESEKRKEL